jgi:toxin CptA
VQRNQVIDIILKPSRQLAVLLVIAHVAAVAVVWSLELPLWMHIGLKLTIAASLGLALLKNGWFGYGRAAVALRIEPAGKSGEPDAIEVRLRNGKTVRGCVVDGSFVAPYLTVVRYRAAGARRFSMDKSILILPDSLDREIFRMLRVRLKWGRAAAV